MGFAIGIGISPTLGQGGGGSLASIFGPSDSGFLYYPASAAYLFQDTAGTTPVAAADDPVARFNDQSGKGNNATIATAGQRPTWKSNSGKPYLLHDGTAQRLLSAIVPGTAMTLASAFNGTATGRTMIGGGAVAGNIRCDLSINNAGQLGAGWGATNLNTITGGGVITSGNHYGLVRADTSTVELWLDGVLVYSAAASGSANGGGALAVGARNNNGAFDQFFTNAIYASLAINRRVTDVELARIHAKFATAF
jgi:hypothetical protein